MFFTTVTGETQVAPRVSCGLQTAPEASVEAPQQRCCVSELNRKWKVY